MPASSHDEEGQRREEEDGPSAYIGGRQQQQLQQQDMLLLEEEDLTASFLVPLRSDENGDDDDARRTESNRIHRRLVASAVTRMRRVGHFLRTITVLTMLVVVPLVTYHALGEKRADLAAFWSAGVMVLGTVILSTRLVYLHLTHWYMPDVQKYVVRILWMVPLYAVQSWLSLRIHKARLYIDTLRDFYEAYVISSFLYYLIELLGGQDALVRMLQVKSQNEENRHLGEHPYPVNLCIQPWELGKEFMLQCKHGVLQYVVVKTLTTFLVTILEPLGLYGEGEFHWRVGYPYIAFVLNVSVCYALYCLVKLFYAVRYELHHPINWHPVGKFLCVKGVVFFTWWQSCAIFFLRAHNLLKDIGTWTSDDIANGLQDYLICIEMVFFAIAHSFTFTYKEYLPPNYYNNDNSNSNHHDLPTTTAADSSTNECCSKETGPLSYHPPPVTIRTLPRPMGFRDAFWDSTLPKETISDIKELRNGLSSAKTHRTNKKNDSSTSPTREEEQQEGSSSNEESTV